MSQIARRHDVNADPVFIWPRDPRLAPDEEAADEHAESLSFGINDAAVERSREAEADGSAPAGRIEPELAGGHRLQIVGPFDPEALARLIRGLSGS